MKSDIFVILTFDVSTNQKINNFFKELFTDEKLMITPHITIAHFTNISEKKITKYSNKIMDQFETKNLILKPT